MTVRKNCGAGPTASRLGGIALRGLLGTTFLCGTALPALAAGGDHDTLDLSNLERLPDGSLQNLRGGFMIGSFNISFGVTITTTVNGATVLQTSFNLNNPGQMSTLGTTIAQSVQGAVNGAQGAGGGKPGSFNVNVGVKVKTDPVQQAVNEFQQAVDNKLADTSGGGIGQVAQIPAGAASTGETTLAATPPVVAPAIVAPTTAPPTTVAPTATTEQVTLTGNGQTPPADPPPVNSVTQEASSTPASGSTVAGGNGSAGGFQGTQSPLPAPGSGDGATGSAGVQTNVADTTTPPAATQPANAASDIGSWVVSQLADGSGVRMTSADLATTIIQHFGNGTGFSTDINNTANDRTFTNTTDINLGLNNFAQVTAQSAVNHLLTNLANDMAHQSSLGN